MKKSILLFVLVVFSAMSVYAFSGRIGAQVSYDRYYNSKLTAVTSQGVSVDVVGSNTFDSRNIFGLEYYISKEFTFGENAGTNPWRFGLSSLFEFGISDLLSLDLTAGAEYGIIPFGEITTNTLGITAGCGMNFQVIPHFIISLGIDYAMPVMMFYGSNAKLIAPDSHIISYGLMFSYSY